MRLPPIRPFVNIVGGGLSLVSILFPWFVIGGTYGISMFDPSPFVWFVPLLVLLGGGISMLSRYGALLTSLGFVAYEASPPTLFLATIGPNAPRVFGPGFWIAWIGIIVSLQGESWNANLTRLKLPNVINWVLVPWGGMLTLIGGFTSYYGAVRGLTFLEIAPGFAVVTTGIAIVLSGLSHTSAYPTIPGNWAKRTRR